MSNASWVRHNSEGWVVRSTGKTGDMVTVVAKSGRRKDVRLGRKLAPNTYAIGPADKIGEAVEENGNRWLLVDGQKFFCNKACQLVWEGDTKSMKFKVVLATSVLADQLLIGVMSHENGNWIDNNLVGPNRGHSFQGAVQIVRHIHENW